MVVGITLLCRTGCHLRPWSLASSSSEALAHAGVPPSGTGMDESIRSLSISGDGVAYTFVVSAEAWPSIVATTSIGTPSR